MALTHLPLAQISEGHLVALVKAGAAESLHIEYKRETYGGGDEARREFLADISSFANSLGGDLIIGMTAAKGVPTGLHPFTGDADAEVLRLEQMARDGLSPRIPNLRIVAVSLARGGFAIVLRIPKSYNPPHRVIFRNSGRFWARSSAGKFEPSVEELRHIFVERPLVGDRIRSFRAERAAKIASGDAPVRLLGGGNLILHVIPFRAFDLEAMLPLEEVSRYIDRFPPLNRMSANDHRFTLDGLLTASNAKGLSEPQRAYVQVFRNGIVEAVASSLVRGPGKDMIMLPTIEISVVQNSRLYAHSLQSFGIEPPFAVAVTLTNVRGINLLQRDNERGFMEDIPRAVLDRDELHFVETVFEAVPQSHRDCATRLRATLDHMANAAGLPASQHFDADGTYKLLRDPMPRAC
jgi:hypothetical protein